ncbi:hypothetical protein VNO77_08248 [Canavalia gladiata]|uniref:Uncharacterized protein n=1 Tax=Canavalia gladiata TaxID=3824 RepID=A0AAN9QW54_CANGL
MRMTLLHWEETCVFLAINTNALNLVFLLACSLPWRSGNTAILDVDFALHHDVDISIKGLATCGKLGIYVLNDSGSADCKCLLKCSIKKTKFVTGRFSFCRPKLKELNCVVILGNQESRGDFMNQIKLKGFEDLLPNNYLVAVKDLDAPIEGRRFCSAVMKMAPSVEWYLHDLLRYALGVLHIVTLDSNSRKMIVNAILSNSRVEAKVQGKVGYCMVNLHVNGLFGYQGMFRKGEFPTMSASLKWEITITYLVLGINSYGNVGLLKGYGVAWTHNVAPWCHPQAPNSDILIELSVLSLLCQENESKIGVLFGECIPPLLRLLKPSPVKGQVAAAKAISAISQVFLEAATEEYEN